MKIAYVYDALYPYIKGGVEKRIWELATRLSDEGHEVHLFAINWWNGSDTIVKSNVYIHGVCLPQEFYCNGRRSIDEALYFAFHVLKPLLRYNFDIIDCQQSPYFPCFSSKISSLYNRSQLVITWHEVWGDYWYDYLGAIGVFGKFVERATARLTQHNIVVSNSTKGYLEGLGLSSQPIEVIPNGIDLQNIRNIKPSSDKSDLIFAGRLIKEKGVLTLIDAIPTVKKEYPNVKCTIIGDGPEREKLEKQVKSLNLDEDILFLGFVEDYNDVLSYMKASKVFTIPSQREGFGIVALEANACGLPVITVKHPRNAICDLIQPQKNGYICAPSPGAISDAIIAGLRHCHSMRYNCISTASTYDWADVARQVEGYYEKLVS